MMYEGELDVETFGRWELVAAAYEDKTVLVLTYDGETVVRVALGVTPTAPGPAWASAKQIEAMKATAVKALCDAIAKDIGGATCS